MILLMKDGSLPWTLNEWFNECMYYAAVGYSDPLNVDWAYYIYDGTQVEGDHTFTFLF